MCRYYLDVGHKSTIKNESRVISTPFTPALLINTSTVGVAMGVAYTIISARGYFS